MKACYVVVHSEVSFHIYAMVVKLTDKLQVVAFMQKSLLLKATIER